MLIIYHVLIYKHLHCVSVTTVSLVEVRSACATAFAGTAPLV